MAKTTYDQAATDLRRFDERLDGLFARALEKRPLRTKQYAFGKLRLQVEWPEGLYPDFLRPMDFAGAGDSATADLTVRLLDSVGAGVPVPRPTFPISALGPRCDLRSGDYLLEMRTWLAILYTYSLRRRLGYYWYRDAARLPWWEGSFPLRQHFHWYGVHSAYQAAHAGAVGLAEGGVIIVGKSGSGKTTSTLACLGSDLFYAGDDYILMEEQADAAWRVHTLYDTAKLKPEDLDRFPQLAPHCINRDKLPLQKAIFQVNEHWPASMTRGFPLKAILVPRITGQAETQLRPAPASAAMMALAPTSILQFAGGGRSAFTKFAKLCEKVPCYYLDAGTHMPGIPRAITRFLESA